MLDGRGVGLREFHLDDVDQALALVGDDQVTSWLSFDTKDRAGTEAMLRGVVERAALTPRTEYYLAVVLAGAGELVGFARLGLDGVQAGKLGYAIRADHWGHGHATDACRAMTNFGFGTLGLHRISAAIGETGTNRGRLRRVHDRPGVVALELVRRRRQARMSASAAWSVLCA
jgi:RimJ/RimL family protein N-acetyltransferase